MFRKSEFTRLRFHDFQWIILMDLLTPFLVFQHHFTKLMQELFYILLFRFAAHTADSKLLHNQQKTTSLLFI